METEGLMGFAITDMSFLSPVNDLPVSFPLLIAVQKIILTEWRTRLAKDNLGKTCPYFRTWSRMASVHLLHQRLWKMTTGTACSRILDANISEMGGGCKGVHLVSDWLLQCQ